MKRVEELVQDYLDEKYKALGFEFIVQGLLVEFRCKDEKDNIYYVTSTVATPKMECLSEEYKDGLDKYAVDPAIKVLTKRREEENASNA